ncbi:unnamed protein product [Leptosia nina]|uniref:DNA primase large subunit C-terminal domain-containing protein n=1 Tax=Leptosia nina TaxID=320188 RepID=A0AAV1J5V7_9NEOP
MTFFYLSPAKGNLQIHVLETIVIKRLEHLNAILSNNAIQYNEYVMEGSVYDNVGHFMLCLAAIIEQSIDFYKFVLKTEEALFQHRLKSLSGYDLRRFAKKLLRIIRKTDLNTSISEPLQVLCQYLSLKNYAHHIYSECDNQCSSYFLKFKFFHCLQFLSKRQVEVQNGIALVPCKKWKEYLIILFKNNLKYRLYNTQLDNINSDPRISGIIRSIRKTLSLWEVPVPNVLTSQNVDEKSKLFPPCMVNLHKQLRTRHRLSHEQRFNYSLFLKDSGMPLNESILFWKAEYSSSPNGHSCSHNWAKDEKKFLYGIRHMYGLEGGRKNYSCRSCHQIQGIENASSEGGCPFKSFHEAQLKELLHSSQTGPPLSEINDLIEKKQYTKACLTFLQIGHKDVIDCNKVNLNFTPVKFYTLKNK